MYVKVDLGNRYKFDKTVVLGIYNDTLTLTVTFIQSTNPVKQASQDNYQYMAF